MRPESESELAEIVAGLNEPVRVVGGGTRGVTGSDRMLCTEGLRGITLYEPGALTLVKRGFVNAIGEFGVPVGSSIYYSGGKGITEPEVLTIIAEAPGVGRVVRAGIHAHPTKDQWLGDLQLEPLPETTRITFELADGTPLAGMEVMAVPGSWASLIARDRRHAPFVHGDDTATWQTDESGSVTLAAASREPWSVWLVRPSGQENRKPPPDLEVTPGDEDVRAVIRGHLMHIHVLDEAGDVAAGAQWEASGWPADRRDAAERVWKKVTTPASVM